ncbi:unnamed protein product [Sphagnum compactum]
MDQEKELVLALRAQMLEPQNCLEQVQGLFLLVQELEQEQVQQLCHPQPPLHRRRHISLTFFTNAESTPQKIMRTKMSDKDPAKCLELAAAAQTTMAQLPA